jgi:hypothetical protein
MEHAGMRQGRGDVYLRKALVETHRSRVALDARADRLVETTGPASSGMRYLIFWHEQA